MGFYKALIEIAGVEASKIKKGAKFLLKPKMFKETVAAAKGKAPHKSVCGIFDPEFKVWIEKEDKK